VQAKGYDLDLTKLTINVTKAGLDGQVVSEILAKEYNIQVDCADIYNLIAILGVGTKRKDMVALVNAIKDIGEKYQGDKQNWTLTLPSLSTEMVLSPRDVFLCSKTRSVSLKNAAGYISAQTLTPYPPGIPIIIPGERITQEICDYLVSLDEKSIRVSGQDNKKLKTIRVVKVD